MSPTHRRQGEPEVRYRLISAPLLHLFFLERQVWTLDASGCREPPSTTDVHLRQSALQPQADDPVPRMSHSKRNFTDFKAESSEDGQTEPRGQALGAHGAKRQKNKHGKKSTEPPKNINETKRRIRNIERRFRVAQNLPADVRNDMERELIHLKQTVVDAEEDKKRSKMITKYHMVRFFGTQSPIRLDT